MRFKYSKLDTSKFKRYANTKEGKQLIIIFVLGFIVGVLWKVLFVTALVFGLGYMLYYIFKKKTNTLKNEEKV